MKKLHFMVLKNFPLPFFGALGMFLFLLLMQFLMKYLPDMVGKDLPLGVIFELIVYNLSYMFTLAVPMSALIAVLITFGKLSETRAYLVIKDAGISFLQIVWPIYLVGFLLTGVMWHFNNEVLPELSYKSYNLWQDIKSKKPGFELKPNIFFNGLRGYSIVAERIKGGNELENLKLFDYTKGQQNQVTLVAEKGYLESNPSTMELKLLLEKGAVHRYKSGTEEKYERIAFETYSTYLDLSDLAFERSDPNRGVRSDRTMSSSDTIALIDSLESKIASRKEKLTKKLQMVQPLDTTQVAPNLDLAETTDTTQIASSLWVLNKRSFSNQQSIYQTAMSHARTLTNEISGELSSYEWERQRMNRYWTEVYKKRSMAFACLLFIFIGAPIGLGIKRGGLGMVGATAGAIFIFYWAMLVNGEKFADRDLVAPWIAIWSSSLIGLGFGSWLVMKQLFSPPARDWRNRLQSFWMWIMQTLFKRKSSK